jgi:hypothetical protein
MKNGKINKFYEGKVLTINVEGKKVYEVFVGEEVNLSF